MSDAEEKKQAGGEDERAVASQERGALIFSIISVLVILLIASPCLCYFGAGLFQGVNILRTGQQTNPARQGYQRQGADWRGNYQRPARYNRTFDAAEQQDASEDLDTSTEPE